MQLHNLKIQISNEKKIPFYHAFADFIHISAICPNQPKHGYGKILILYAFNNKITDFDASKNPYLYDLRISNNLLTSLDVSKNTGLQDLRVYGNRLDALDLSKNTELKELYCYDNRMEELDLTNQIRLTAVSAFKNRLEKVILPPANLSILTRIGVFNNRLRGQEMNRFINDLATLPMPDLGLLYIFDTLSDPADQNVATTAHVDIARGKKWDVRDYFGGNSVPYDGVPVSIEENSQVNYKLWNKDGIIYFSNVDLGATISLYSTNGTLLYNGSLNDQFSIPVQLKNGVYILQIDGVAHKIAIN